MKATVIYDKAEVCAIMLAYHQAKFPGLRWTAELEYSDRVKCELVEEPQAEEAQP